jgi:hypothetical protein
MKEPPKQLDSDTFDLLRGRKWKNLEADDSVKISWFDDLDADLYKYILVSGENFLSEGREGEEGFITENLIADPDFLVNDPSEKVIILFDGDIIDAAMLTDGIERAGSWLESLRENEEVVICQAMHKVKSASVE